MRKDPKNITRNVLTTLTLAGMMLGFTAVPAMASTGDFYDTTTNVLYKTSALTTTTKAALISAYTNGDAFVKELANGKFLDYNGAYALFGSKLAAGFSAADSILAVATDPTLYKTIDTTKFTDSSSIDDSFTVIDIN